jgi:hypothetical protein
LVAVAVVEVMVETHQDCLDTLAVAVVVQEESLAESLQLQAQ